MSLTQLKIVSSLLSKFLREQNGSFATKNCQLDRSKTFNGPKSRITHIKDA